MQVRDLAALFARGFRRSRQSHQRSRHIGTPGLEVQQMLTRVGADVVAATGKKQVPWSNSSLLGEVYLAAK